MKLRTQRRSDVGDDGTSDPSLPSRYTDSNDPEGAENFAKRRKKADLDEDLEEPDASAKRLKAEDTMGRVSWIPILC